MTATRMIELMNRVPFQPIEIHLNNGTHILVEHPYQIATQPNAAACTIYFGVDQMRIVAYRNIAEVITSEPQTAESA